MNYKYSTIINSFIYDTQGLCSGINLRRHVGADLEEVGAFRIQEDWRHLVGPLEKPYKGVLGPDFSFITVAVPECLPDRLEITSYALEFSFIHDDVINKDIHDASLDEMEQPWNRAILCESMAIDPERAMVVTKSWAAGVQHSSRRRDDTHFNTPEEYIPYMCLDMGYMLWHGIVTFDCAITIPEEKADETKELPTPALITASLTKDL